VRNYFGSWAEWAIVTNLPREHPRRKSFRASLMHDLILTGFDHFVASG